MTVISGVSEALMSAGSNGAGLVSGLQSDELTVTESFMNFMNGYGNKTEQNVNLKQESFENNDDSEAYESAKTFSSVNNSKISKSKNDSTYQVTEKDVSAIQKFENEVKSLIKEKLGITDEELVMAMQNLGLNLSDLVNQSNLANLLTEVTNVNSVEELLTVSGIGEVLKGVNTLASHLANELMVEPNQMNEIMNLVSQMETVSPGELADNTILSTNEIPERESAVNMFNVESVNVSNDDVIAESNLFVNETTQTIAEDAEVITAKETLTGEIITQNPVNENEENVVKDADEKVEDTDIPEDDTKAEVNEKGNTLNHQKEAPKKFDVSDANRDSSKQNLLGGERQDMSVEVKSETQIDTNVGTQEVRFEGYVDADDIISQIMNQARVMNAETVSSIEMQLNPENLGKILLQVTEKEGQIRAQIMTQNETVKQAIESQMADFKVNMNQLGIKVDAVEVTVSSHAFEENLEGDFNQNAQDNQSENSTHERRNLNLSMLEDEDIDLSEEEQIAANIMRDNGNQMDVIA